MSKKFKVKKLFGEKPVEVILTNMKVSFNDEGIAEVTEELADLFVTIPGYELLDVAKAPKSKKAEEAPKSKKAEEAPKSKKTEEAPKSKKTEEAPKSKKTEEAPKSKAKEEPKKVKEAPKRQAPKNLLRK